MAKTPKRPECLIQHVSLRLLENPEEADRLTRDVMNWIDQSLGWNYAWPGNFRELEQCVRNVLVRNSYHPPVSRHAGFMARLQEQFAGMNLSLDELTTQYVTWTYSKTQNYAETARRIGIDQRTAKRKVDPSLLEQLNTHE